MKKVLSFVLILALVLGSFSFAFGLTDIKDSANTDAINAVNDLGIVEGFEDGSFKPDQAVNRAQFAAMITRALGVPDSALAGFSATSFKDTDGYGWAVPYLAFCESKGIMLGDGMGNAMPGRTISLNESVTMVLRALGYTQNSAQLVGTWPANYVTLAQDLKLYKDIATMTTVDRASAAQVIYNALWLDKVQVDADGSTAAYVPAVKLYEALGAKPLNLVAGKADYTIITKAHADNAIINLTPYIGAYVIAYTNDDGEVIATGEVGSTFLTGKYVAADKEFQTTDVDYKATASGGAMKTTYGTGFFAEVATNGGIDGTLTGTLTAGAVYTIAAKLVGKTITDVYSVVTWTPSEAFFYETTMLEDDSLNGYDFVLDKDDAIDKTSFELKGAASLDAIAEDDVVTVYTDTTLGAGDVVRVEVGTEKVTGKATLQDGTDWTIGGKVLEAAAGAALVAGTDTLALGDTGTASLNYKGQIANWEIDDATADNYAIVTATLIKNGRDYYIKALDKAGVEKDYMLADGLTTAFTTSVGITSVGALAVGDLVTVSVDKDGAIDKLVAFDYDAGSPTANQLNKGRTLYGAAKLDKAVVVFSYDAATLATSDFDAVPIADIKVEDNLTGTYTYTLGSSVEVMVVSEDFTGVDSTFAVLNKSLLTFNDDGDKVLELRGFANGAAYTALTNDRTVGAGLNGGFAAPPAAGATIGSITGDVVYKLTTDSDGVVTAAVATTGAAINPVTGLITDKDGNYLVEVGAGNWKVIDPEAVVYTYDLSDDEYSAAKITDIKAPSVAIAASFVKLYQVDSDSEVYDFIVICRP